MAEEWFTYIELGERLGVSAEAARQKAIRYRWPRRTTNDGKAQVRVDVDDVKASTPVRKPRNEQPDNPRSTPYEPPSDTRMLDALKSHIETLKAMVSKAESIADRERVRADDERTRADGERDRAERLQVRIDDLLSAQSKADEHHRVVADLDVQIKQLREMIEAARRPWWRRMAG